MRYLLYRNLRTYVRVQVEGHKSDKAVINRTCNWTLSLSLVGSDVFGMSIKLPIIITVLLIRLNKKAFTVNTLNSCAHYHFQRERIITYMYLFCVLLSLSPPLSLSALIKNIPLLTRKYNRNTLINVYYNTNVRFIELR